MKSIRPLLAILASVFLLGGCASTVTDRPRIELGPLAQSVAQSASRPMSAQAAPIDSGPAVTELLTPTVVRGNDTMFSLPRARVEEDVGGESVSLRFEQAPVTDVVHAILGDILGLPYVVNQPVSGSLTIHTTTPLRSDQVLPVLEAVLQANGLSIVLDQSGVYHVGRPETLRGVAPSLGSVGGSLPSGHNVVIVPLQYIGANEMADILLPLASQENILRVDSVRNLLILAGTRSRLEGLIDIVRTFDVDLLSGMSFAIFPLEHLNVADIKDALGGVMPGSQQSGSGEGAAGAQIGLVGPLSGVVRLIALERLNAVLVVSPRAHYIDQAREWIARLDQPRGEAYEPQLFIYPVHNSNAAHLADLLNVLFGGSGTSASDSRADSGVAPALGSRSTGAAGDGATTESRGGGAESAQGGLSQISLEGNIKVVADELNNNLLIYAPRSEFRKIETALRRLDITPSQVLIEASIVEVTLTDEFEFGLQWYFQGGIGGGLQGQGTFNPNQSGAIRRSQPGFSYSAVDAAGQVRAVLNMLAQRSLLNVISSPSVLVQDNHEAEIQVGDQQPVRSSTTISDGGTTTSSIQFKNTGVMLAVKPSVTAGGLVSMTINQSVTDVGSVDEATGQRSFLERTIRSRVSVRSGETVVLGGLIRGNQSTGNLGVPVLKDIPVLGHLFGTTSRSNNRTELIVLITPRVVQNDEELRNVSAEMRARLFSSMGEYRGRANYSSRSQGVVAPQ